MTAPHDAQAPRKRALTREEKYPLRLTPASPLQAGFDADEFIQAYDRLFGSIPSGTPGFVLFALPYAERDASGDYYVTADGICLQGGWGKLLSIPAGSTSAEALSQILARINGGAQNGSHVCGVYMKLHLYVVPGVPDGSNVAALRAFSMDIDVQGGAHSEEDLPTAEQAVEVVGQHLPVAPDVVVWSGGGFHVHHLLETPLDPSDPICVQITDGIIDALLTNFDEAGRGTADTKPTKNWKTSWYRMPGSINAKRPGQLAEVKVWR